MLYFCVCFVVDLFGLLIVFCQCHVFVAFVCVVSLCLFCCYFVRFICPCLSLFLLVAFVSIYFLAEFHIPYFFDLLGIGHWFGIMVGVGLTGGVRVVFLGGDGFALATVFLAGLSPFCVNNHCVSLLIHIYSLHHICLAVIFRFGSDF